MAVMAGWTVVVSAGLLVAFGYPLAHGLTDFSQEPPSYVQAAEHGRGSIGPLVTRFHLQAWADRKLIVFLSLLVGTSIGDWVGGFFGSFVAALLSIPAAGALQVVARKLWQASARPGPSPRAGLSGGCCGYPEGTHPHDD